MTIQFSIYTCPPISTAAPSPDKTSQDAGLWSPLSCTLIYTRNTAVLVDCPPTIAATHELASWVTSILPAGCILKYFIASHAHGDHFFGFPVLEKTFPDIKAISTKSVAEGVEEQYTPALYNGLWTSHFPSNESGGGLPELHAKFTVLPPSNELNLDGHLIKLHDVPHGDTHANSFVYVPELGLVVAGDIVYNGDCHQWLGEAASPSKRNQWVESLSQIAALKPKVIVPGHTFKPMSEPDENRALAMLEGTKTYIEAFAEELGVAESENGLFQSMRAQYPRWNLWILSGSCHSAFAKKSM
ncbi:hypothetical protein BROUX41_006617 [Berkeleyomyces rouxiae]|uniref:uncharacterized protein n=1 Tax=Berkeleyomyces rouxiae TaxID=2035830 RepID=UPI003B7FF664